MEMKKAEKRTLPPQNVNGGAAYQIPKSYYPALGVYADFVCGVNGDFIDDGVSWGGNLDRLGKCLLF